MINYDSSAVGVPYVRAQRITIEYPDRGLPPTVRIEQSLAVKMADGSVRELENKGSFSSSFNMAADGSKPIPLVFPDTGLAIGQNTTLNNTMLAILAVVRNEQNKQEAASMV